MPDDKSDNIGTIIVVIEGLIRIVFLLMQLAGLTEEQKKELYLTEKAKFDARNPDDLANF